MAGTVVACIRRGPQNMRDKSWRIVVAKEITVDVHADVEEICQRRSSERRPAFVA